jgi:hypothetical protein
LYKQLLASLRLLKSHDSIDLQLNEQFDYAHILYKKGLFAQSLKIIDKAKEAAKANSKINFLVSAIALEKRIETLHVTLSIQNRAEQLAAEVNDVNQRIDNLSKLSNLSLLLYSWFIKNGHARNKADEVGVTKYLQQHLPLNAQNQTGFYEKLYYYQSYAWYAFIKQDFLMYYRYAQKWVSLFEDEPAMIRVETGHYIKGMHILLNAHFDLRNYQKFEIDLKKFETFAQTDRVQLHENFRVQAFVYIYSAKINQHCMLGTFNDGLLLVPFILQNLKKYDVFIDSHRIMVINYKIATLYFGSGDYSTCIDYLQKIINKNTELRSDLQCYTRLLHLIAHYELGNVELMEYLTKSVYRFMAKKQNLTVVEEEMFKFLRKSFAFSRSALKQELQKFLAKIEGLQKDRFETRSFAYLDIISWLQSKVQQKAMSEILGQKVRRSKERKY